jgi:hypothetical protein
MNPPDDAVVLCVDEKTIGSGLVSPAENLCELKATGGGYTASKSDASLLRISGCQHGVRRIARSTHILELEPSTHAVYSTVSSFSRLLGRFDFVAWAHLWPPSKLE